ncbi:kinase-like protein [Rozella allomycis CSF55]|uniref:Kinase-like protein n=1 Tax=Rozella allomycis (strain CSF55) TaxID=988480 RepID=A0A4V1J092_ROZAC|nr:kinase-like protein [Rozella allomycis CSF55]
MEQTLMNKRILQGGFFSEQEIYRILSDLAESGVIHFDIKPANILIDGDYRFRIGDFGLSCQDSELSTVDTEGDKFYIAPEILEGFYDKPADIFSIGLIALEVASNIELPSEGEEWRKLRTGDFSQIPFEVDRSPELLTLITKMLDPNPSQRISADQLNFGCFILMLESSLDSSPNRPKSSFSKHPHIKFPNFLSQTPDPSSFPLTAAIQNLVSNEPIVDVLNKKVFTDSRIKREWAVESLKAFKDGMGISMPKSQNVTLKYNRITFYTPISGFLQAESFEELDSGHFSFITLIDNPENAAWLHLENPNDDEKEFIIHLFTNSLNWRSIIDQHGKLFQYLSSHNTLITFNFTNLDILSELNLSSKLELKDLLDLILDEFKKDYFKLMESIKVDLLKDSITANQILAFKKQLQLQIISLNGEPDFLLLSIIIVIIGILLGLWNSK